MVYYAEFADTRSMNDYLMSIEEEYIRLISIETVSRKLDDGKMIEIFRVWFKEL